MPAQSLSERKGFPEEMMPQQQGSASKMPPKLCMSVLALSSEPPSSQVPASTLTPLACLQTTPEEPCHFSLKVLPWLPSTSETIRRDLSSHLEALQALATCSTTPQTTAPKAYQVLCPQGAPWDLPLLGSKDYAPGSLHGRLLVIPSPPKLFSTMP